MDHFNECNSIGNATISLFFQEIVLHGNLPTEVNDKLIKAIPTDDENGGFTITTNIAKYYLYFKVIDDYKPDVDYTSYLSSVDDTDFKHVTRHIMLMLIMAVNIYRNKMIELFCNDDPVVTQYSNLLLDHSSHTLYLNPLWIPQKRLTVDIDVSIL